MSSSMPNVQGNEPWCHETGFARGDWHAEGQRLRWASSTILRARQTPESEDNTVSPVSLRRHDSGTEEIIGKGRRELQSPESDIFRQSIGPECDADARTWWISLFSSTSS